MPSNRHQLKSQRLLDVGAVAGSAYAKWPFFKVTSIDINPRADSVLKFDWLEFTPGAVDMSDHVFDLLALSLVLNFQGDLPKRAEMILHAHRFLKPDGKVSDIKTSP